MKGITGIQFLEEAKEGEGNSGGWHPEPKHAHLSGFTITPRSCYAYVHVHVHVRPLMGGQHYSHS